MQLYHFMETNDRRRDLNELYRIEKPVQRIYTSCTRHIDGDGGLDAYDKILSNLNNKCICKCNVAYGMHIIRIMPYNTTEIYIMERGILSRV